MAINAEQLNIILAARDKEFTKAMDRANRRVENFARKSQSNLSKTSSSFDLIAGAAKRLAPALAAAFGASQLQNFVEATAEIGNLSDVAGVSAERFQELAFASSNFGIQQDKLSDILKDVNDKFGDYVQTGAGPLADFFDNIAPKIGLTADEFAGLSSEQKLGKYVSALEEANVSQAEMTFYLEALASDATLLQGVFANNGQELDRLSKKIRDAGGVMDSDLIEQAREAKEELAIASQVISANLSVALADLIPLLVGGAEAAAKIAQNIGVAYQAIHELINPTSNLETAIDNVVLAMADEIRQSRQLEIQLGKSQEMSVGIAKQKLAEAEARHANAAAAIEEARAITLQSPEYKKIAQQLRTLRDAQRGIAAGDDLVPLTKQEQYETLSQQIVETMGAMYGMLDADQALLEQFERTGGNIEKLREALNNAKDGMITLGNGITVPITKSDRLTASTDTTSKSLDDLIGKLDLSGVSLLLLGGRTKATAEDLQNLTSIAGTFQNELENVFMSILDGPKAFEDAIKQMAAQVIRDLYRILVVQRLVGSFDQATGTGTGLVGAIMGLGKASGGPVQAGQAYTVGEHGRELFVPQTAGRILSVPQTKAAMSGGGEVTVVQNINVSTGVQQTVRTEIKSLMPQIAESAKSAVMDAKRRGGSYGRSFA